MKKDCILQKTFILCIRLLLLRLAIKFISVFRIKPSVKLFEKWYDILSVLGANIFHNFTCMNYGYQSLENDAPEINLEDERQHEIYSLQLYNHLISFSGKPVQNRNILEIGSGRGGGAHYLAKHCKPCKYTALELSQRAVDFCRLRYADCNNLEFIKGSALELPFPDNSFDFIINVESSHCYPDFDKYLAEVKRVLKPDGLFLITDFRYTDKIDEFKDKLNSSGLLKICETDITENIIKSLNFDSDRRKKLIDGSRVLGFIKKSLYHFAGCIGSSMYNDFLDRRRIYLSLSFAKQEQIYEN